MKKVSFVWLTALALACGAGTAVAQSTIHLGVQGGLSIPDLHAGSGSNPVSEGYSSRMGPYFGALGQFGFSRLFSLQAEVNYSAQGGKKNGKQAIAGQDFNPQAPAGSYFYANFKSVARLNYIEVPVLAKFTFPLGRTLNIAVDAGPYVGFLVAAKNKTSGESMVYGDPGETTPVTAEAQSFDKTEDIKDQLHHTNWGVQGGVGLEQTLGKGYLFLHLGGNYGLMNIQKGSAHGKNNTGAATAVLGYALEIK